jgi:hypothetical protein
MAINAIPPRRPTETSITTAFHQAFSRFRAVLEASTIPVDGGRRVDGIAHSVALSQHAGQLLDAIFEVRTYLAETYGTALTDYPAGLVLMGADSPDGPWTEIPATEIKITCIPIESSALLMASLESATRVLAQSPDKCGQRWNANDVISDEELARIESAASLLLVHEELFDRLSTGACSQSARQEEPVQSGLRELEPAGQDTGAEIKVVDDPKISDVEGSHSIQRLPFSGGKMVFFEDRVEFCSVDICSGPRATQKRKTLDVLRQKDNDGSFKAYSSKTLAKMTDLEGGENRVPGQIRDLRDQISEALSNKANIKCGQREVILSGGPGYRFSHSVSVQEGADGGATRFTDTSESDNASNVRKEDVRKEDVRKGNVRKDGTAAARRAWLLERLRAGDRLQAPAVEQQFQCSLKTAQRDLQSLKDEGLIKFVGGRKLGYYCLASVTKPAVD